MLSSRAVAPGAEEFLPPHRQRHLAAAAADVLVARGRRPLEAERTNHVEVEVEHDFAAAPCRCARSGSTSSDQLVTLFGVERAGARRRVVGHYFVGNVGDVDASGLSAGIRAAMAGRVHGVGRVLADAARRP